MKQLHEILRYIITHTTQKNRLYKQHTRIHVVKR